MLWQKPSISVGGYRRAITNMRRAFYQRLFRTCNNAE